MPHERVGVLCCDHCERNNHMKRKIASLLATVLTVGVVTGFAIPEAYADGEVQGGVNYGQDRGVFSDCPDWLKWLCG